MTEMMEHRKLKNWNKEFLAIYQPLIKKLLLSVSIFSFVFSYSNLCSSLSYCSPKFHYFSASSIHLLMSQALNKNCLFLICNGLLVFLAKTSGLVQPSPPDYFDLNDALHERIGDGLQTALRAATELYSLEEHADGDHEPKHDEEDEEKIERPEEVSIFIAESEEEGGECDHQPTSFWLFNDDKELYGQEEEEQEVKEEEEQQDDEKGGELSTQQLNQKFEEFIRRMKEEIMINEARQKGVMLN